MKKEKERKMCSFAEKLICSSIWDMMDDLSAVPPENVISYLLDRMERGQIYTWVGALLLALNPINEKEISTDYMCDLQPFSTVSEYDGVCSLTHKEVTPHIHAVASRAHYRIIHGLGKPGQMIVLNGETGAGKTWNAWKALNFLTTGILSTSTNARRCDMSRGILHKVMDACHLVSAFTTASTEKNDVSSRHVQLVWLEYKKGNICGATISSYLLEKNRVTRRSCNFHIFNQMLTNTEFVNIKLFENMGDFDMLNAVDSTKRQQFCNDFQRTSNAIDSLDFTLFQKKNIFQVLFLIIHMRNIQFVQTNDQYKIDTDSELSKLAVESTCELAGLQKDDVEHLLTSILIRPRSSMYPYTECRRNLDTEDACRYRLHSIIHHIYDLLFHWLISCINKSLTDNSHSERLGILDVFGFECFSTNGIEQLYVNYVNERVQQHFVRYYLESCRKDLKDEGLIDHEEPSGIAKLYNDRIDTIEKHLFAPLNDICLSTFPNDLSLLLQNISNQTRSSIKRFLYTRNENFVIQHYAGIVEYSASDVLSKNIDKIPDEITITFGASKKAFLRSLISVHKSHCDEKVKRSTTLSKLRYNVDLLINELNNCDLHYVRCIRPQRLDNHEWDRVGFHNQLISTGIIDALPLARCKYPIYFIYKEFFERYKRKYKVSSVDFKMGCRQILNSSRLTKDDDTLVHYGKRLIFLTEKVFLQLESARMQHHIECVRKIESYWLKYRNRLQNRRASNQIQHRLTKQLLSQHTKASADVPSEVYKTIDLLHWLDKVRESTESPPSTSEQSFKGEASQIEQNRHKKSVKYHKEEDMYTIKNGVYTFFYKNRILSRRRPPRLPVRIHTRPTCLRNSHCVVHTELPQGLQELTDLYKYE